MQIPPYITNPCQYEDMCPSYWQMRSDVVFSYTCWIIKAAGWNHHIWSHLPIFSAHVLIFAQICDIRCKSIRILIWFMVWCMFKQVAFEA